MIHSCIVHNLKYQRVCVTMLIAEVLIIINDSDGFLETMQADNMWFC
jgi:hypothetical protein